MHVPRRASLGLAAALAVAVVVVAPSPSTAAHYTSNGVRCTVVGTAGNDVLTGTSGRDVICGRGGNDRISARRGDDLVDAGPGEDVVDAGLGNDVLQGGKGSDSLDGGAGPDRIDGGSGRDAVSGRGGADVLRGGADADRVSGDAGSDDVAGDGGADELSGGAGDDDVDGGTGDDLLDGGPDGDDVDGGPGFNVCDVPGDPDDTQVRCVLDEAQPAVESVTATPSVVDVSEEVGFVEIEAHITDDTGVARAQLGPSIANRVSGTPRDGIWTAWIRVPRFSEPGPRDLTVFVRDRVGRTASPDFAEVYDVTNSVVDHEMPVLQSLSLDRTDVDVRTRSASITATAHVTDDLAGPKNIFLCPAHAFPTGEPSFRQSGGCSYMPRVSGTRTDGVYEATYVVEKGAPSGTWNFFVWIDDGAENLPTDFWYGPDQAASLPDWLKDQEIPDGGGVFTVVGTPQDLNAPVLTSVRVTPGAVDTSNGAVEVTVDIAATDLEGVTETGISVTGYPGYPDNHSWAETLDIAWVQDFDLVSGTREDGVWRATFVVPGGTPSGEYFMQVIVRDSSHFESWMSPGSGFGGVHDLTPELAPSGNFFVVDNE